MNKKTIITALLALVSMAGQAQEARIDTIVPKSVIRQGIVRHAVHGTSDQKRSEMLTIIKEADAEQ